MSEGQFFEIVLSFWVNYEAESMIGVEQGFAIGLFTLSEGCQKGFGALEW